MEIHIKDNASGASPDIIDRIVNPFVTTMLPVQGEGPDLVLSSTAMCRHGSEIRVEPEPGVFIEENDMSPVEPKSETGDDGNTDTLDSGREHVK